MADINDRILFSPAPPRSPIPAASGLSFVRNPSDETDPIEFLLVEVTRATGLRVKAINDYPVSLTDSLTVQVL